MIKEATFTSVWDGGYEITTNCKVNTETKEIFDIEINDADSDFVEILDKEYVTIDGKQYDAYPEHLYEDEPDTYFYR